jgi:DNA-binding transcriptional ArsR family regulator
MNGYRWMARRLKAMGHPVRLQILDVLQTEGEACVCHLEARLGQRQAYISQQLSRLRDAGLVADRRDGLNVYYSLSDDSVVSLLHEAQSAMPQGVTIRRRPEPIECPCPKCAEKQRMARASLSDQGTHEGHR